MKSGLCFISQRTLCHEYNLRDASSLDISISLIYWKSTWRAVRASLTLPMAEITSRMSSDPITGPTSCSPRCPMEVPLILFCGRYERPWER